MRINKAFGKWVVAAVGVSNISEALAWGAAGHEIVATIAQMHLNPPVLPLLCSILYPEDDGAQPCTLASVATWADKIRYRARWSSGLHYVGAVGDHPSDTCVFPGDNGWAGREGINVLGGIRNTSSILDEFVALALSGRGGAELKVAGNATSLAQEALKFLIHFVGDLHQPLHLTGRDRGGNGDKVSWDGRVTNLHSLWDGLLIAKSLRTIPANYSCPLPVPEIEAALRGAIYDPYIRRIMWQGVGVGAYGEHAARWEDEVESWLDCPAPVAPGWTDALKQAVLALVAPRRRIAGPPQTTDDATLCPYAWAEPIHALNCELVWPPALDAPEYRTHDACEHGACGAHAHAHGAEDEDEDELSALQRAPRAPRGHYLELDTPEYWGRIEQEWVVEKLLAMGGIRLAGVLNQIFAPLV
ncbi:phospholipase C/P1 nuclease domain-containing protein [Amylostereum chailletii]|nr:phospholipase C/P1 nuclease domain-containing protein [Amylostereum chailletii]